MGANGQSCLLWIDWWPLCMTRSEWASWVQALGAIVALFVAIMIARSAEKARAAEVQEARERTSAEEAARVQQVASAFRIYAARLHSAIISMVEGVNAQLSPGEMSSRLAVLAEASRMGDALPFTELDPNDRERFVTLRLISTEAAFAGKNATAVNKLWPPIQRTFADLERRADSELIQMGGLIKVRQASSTVSVASTVS